ncbi:hypothetical protein GLOTRDRAFT_40380, partial [Gloeophyllum trabeum ATCC 11539]
DGHEKLAEQGLQMGKGVHLPIYALKDQYLSFLHACVIMPNRHEGHIIAHYYLNLIESRGVHISIQLMIDKGSEVNEMIKIHEALRIEAAPDYTSDTWLMMVQFSSIHNTPFKSFWWWKQDGDGHTLHYVLQVGVEQDIFVA